jgi:hypothetical protein
VDCVPLIAKRSNGRLGTARFELICSEGFGQGMADKVGFEWVRRVWTSYGSRGRYSCVLFGSAKAWQTRLVWASCDMMSFVKADEVGIGE